jgi:PAS domain S-box-containing protein
MADARLGFDAAQVLDQLGDAVVVADGVGEIRLANGAAGRLFGWLASELVGQALVAVIPPRFRRAHEAGFFRFVATGSGHMVGGPPLKVAALHRDGS